MLLAGAGAGWPQAAAPQPRSASRSRASNPPRRRGGPAPPPRRRARKIPGLINEIGKLFDKLPSPLKSPQETIEDFE